MPIMLYGVSDVTVPVVPTPPPTGIPGQPIYPPPTLVCDLGQLAQAYTRLAEGYGEMRNRAIEAEQKLAAAEKHIAELEQTINAVRRAVGST